MTEINSKQWITEKAFNVDSAFSLKINSKLDEQQSPFQKVEIFETTELGNLMTIDGYNMITTKENFLYHEMLSHPALFTHNRPKNIVIIGGGDCGTLREVLKHKSVESVHQVDIDEVVTRMSEKYFPELCESNDDPRAHILFDDGIKFMADAKPNSIDVIIVDSTDPVGPGEGLFNRAFYKTCLAALRPDGILVQQSESPIFQLPLLLELREAMSDAGFNHLQTLNFPQPIYPSGWWSCTLASKEDILQSFREDDAQSAEFETLYYNAEIHHGAKALPNFIKKAFNIEK